MTPRTRREFLADLGRGALLGALGPAFLAEWGLSTASAEEAVPPALDFGRLEPLVALLQETPVDRLLAVLVERLRSGTDLRTLVAAGALANARTFGGEDYVGYHALMALGPALAMASESSGPTRALPVLKVLYRNSARIQEVGGRSREVLRAAPAPAEGAPSVRAAVRAQDLAHAEAAFAAHAAAGPARALDALLDAVEDDVDVHRVALAYRSWDLLAVVGDEHAHALLRPPLRYCARAERRPNQALRTTTASVLEARLADAPLGARVPDDAWTEATSRALLEATPEEAADRAAAELAAGVAPAAVGEAIVLAANQLLLRDEGRPEKDARPEKPVGSVHGDSIGLHAQDAANAWRNLARVAEPRHAFACLVVGAYQVARDRVSRGSDFLAWAPYPRPDALERVPDAEPAALLATLDAAVRAGDQARASAAVHRIGARGGSPDAVLAVLRGHATTEDGALHAEKYYRTATEDFAASRPAFRWRHLVALARVTASEFGRPAPGVDEARRLLEA